MQINGINLSPDIGYDELKVIAAKRAGINPADVKYFRILKKSIDARTKNEVVFVYSVEVSAQPVMEEELSFPKAARLPDNQPIVVGAGPAGLFCALTLAKAGLCPLVIERGESVEERTDTVNRFFENGGLNENSNVQFGEGGAGAFSDGKLNTLLSGGYRERVMRIFVSLGASEEILYLNKPHIGTDKLAGIIKALREDIKACGGKFLYKTKFTGIISEKGRLKGIATDKGELFTDAVILATGHSARDVYGILEKSGVTLEQKEFSIGFRIEHLQRDINIAQYGAKFAGHPALGAADYKLVSHTPFGSVYTFCMCPGGSVITAASENGHTVTNGMSLHSRSGMNANAALLFSLKKTDFKSNNPLAGVELQRYYEKKAFDLTGRFSAPVQTVGGFLNKGLQPLGKILPSCLPSPSLFPLHSFYDENITSGIAYAIKDMAKKLKGFDNTDAVLTAPETRSSSPVRISRTVDGNSVSLKGLYPAGEGAGYSGGIVSSAIDGIKAAEAVIRGI